MTAVLLALASATSYAVATVVGHRAATTTSAGAAGGSVLRTARRLLRHPGFLASQLAGALGLALHVAALATGLLVVVQPLLCAGLVIALALGAVVDRRHPGRPLPHRGQWLAAGGVAAGLVLFLTSAAPNAGAAVVHPWVLPASVIGFVLGAIVVSMRVRSGRSPRPAVVLGALVGGAFGLTGVLLKATLALPLTAWPTSWQAYALLLVGISGAGLAQWSYTAGPLVQSQPVMTALEPVIAVALAGPVFGEALAGGALAHSVQLLGLALMVAGVWGVSRWDVAVPARRSTPDARPTPVLSGSPTSAAHGESPHACGQATCGDHHPRGQPPGPTGRGAAFPARSGEQLLERIG